MNKDSSYLILSYLILSYLIALCVCRASLNRVSLVIYLKFPFSLILCCLFRSIPLFICLCVRVSVCLIPFSISPDRCFFFSALVPWSLCVSFCHHCLNISISFVRYLSLSLHVCLNVFVSLSLLLRLFISLSKYLYKKWYFLWYC